jgi:hypothetical protein
MILQCTGLSTGASPVGFVRPATRGLSLHSLKYESKISSSLESIYNLDVIVHRQTNLLPTYFAAAAINLYPIYALLQKRSLVRNEISDYHGGEYEADSLLRYCAV